MNTSPGVQSHGDGRRLAAIVFTDIVGYSSRMQRDETGTRALAKVDLDQMRESAVRHGGEVLKSTGDGLL
ncbi:MAG: adenylate/guanylate cyclase domain-containing protein [Verrucomicrobia bacterium]|nr:adenylate/guanylate cyclase domain-containing protein [Verrucomicrobiota bacterium]